MIIARSPLRISLGGGGTDLPSYYREHGGFLIAGAIDQHVYVTVHKRFGDGLVLRYSRIESVNRSAEVEHPLIRAALEHLGVSDAIEMTTMADVPAGTGLGSSGSFGTAMLKALYRYLRRTITTAELAELACHLEIDVLGEPVGKQDQYAAAFGGVNCYTFEADRVVVEPLAISEDTLRRLDERLLMFSTAITRKAPDILREQDSKTRTNDASMVQNLNEVKEIGYASKRAFELGDLDAFGRLLREHWDRKKKRSSIMSNSDVDRWYELGLAPGAVGGKLVGAGGGGFLMFYAEEPTALRAAMTAAGLPELRYSFDYVGTALLAR
jgi:D-glycero-alpha-D-manno-heptose-7-phosphate kinase